MSRVAKIASALGGFALSRPTLEGARQVTVIPVAIVCAIGSNIAKPGILSQATGAMARAGINIIGVSQTARQTNMQFTVGRDDFEKAHRALHAELCEASS